MTSFLTSILSAITRPWRREPERSEELVRCDAFDAGAPMEIEYRQGGRRMVGRGEPRFDRDGNFAGYAVLGMEEVLDVGQPLQVVPVPGQAESLPYVDDGLRRKQLLLVDRDPASLETIAAILRERGARVTTARSAAEAILALHKHYDLVVTDAGVPVAEGVSFAQQLRQTNGGLPAIVLRKPVDPAELAAEIAQLLTK